MGFEILRDFSPSHPGCGALRVKWVQPVLESCVLDLRIAADARNVMCAIDCRFVVLGWTVVWS